VLDSVKVKYAIKFFLKGKEDPVVFPRDMTISEDIRTLDMVMDFCETLLMGYMDSRSEIWTPIFGIEGERHYIKNDEIQ
jgi:hypothetical protein